MNTKTVVFEVNAEYGEVVVDSGALFLGEVAPIEFKGYTPKEGNTLKLTVFNRSPRRDDTLGGETFAVADNSANEGELDLRYEALQKEFSEKCAHAFTMQINEYEGDRCLPQVIAVGKVVINYSPVVFDPLTGAPATMRGAKGDDGDDGKDLTFDDLTAEQKAELKGEKGEKGDKGDDGKDLSKEVGALELGLDAERGRATSAEGALETRIENLNKTVYEVAGAANTAVKNALAASDKADFIEGKVDNLIDADKGKSVRTIAAEEAASKVADIVAGADTNLDTLKEIADFIKNDPYKAAELENKVALLEDAKANKKDIPDVAPYAKKTEVAADIGAAVASETARAKGAEATLEGRVKELEENGGGGGGGYTFEDAVPDSNDYIHINPNTITTFKTTDSNAGVYYYIDINTVYDVPSDTCFVVDCRDATEPPILCWGAGNCAFFPRTDETDFTCEAGKMNVYWVTQIPKMKVYGYDRESFVVAGYRVQGEGTAIS